MERTLTEQEISKALDRNKLCSLATIEGNKPKQRYMVLYNEGLSIYLATNRRTHKVEELEDNPHVSLLIGYEIGGSKEDIVFEGTCSICTDDRLKDKVWNDDLDKWFNGPQDPEYIILNIQPTHILYTEKDGHQREWFA